MVFHIPFYSFQLEPIQDNHFYVLQLHHFELVNYYKYVSNYENHIFQKIDCLTDLLRNPIFSGAPGDRKWGTRGPTGTENRNPNLSVGDVKWSAAFLSVATGITVALAGRAVENWSPRSTRSRIPTCSPTPSWPAISVSWNRSRISLNHR